MDSSKERLPIVLIACAVFRGILDRPAVDGKIPQMQFLDYGLHLVPGDLKRTLQKTIDGIPEPSLVVLGYGLCGNGLDGLQAGIHTLLVPRADDCIAMFLGSYQAYKAEFEAQPGTYYLTKGWLESGSDPLREYEQLVDRYGADTAGWLMDQQYRHYKRLVLVAHSPEDLEAYRPQAREVARYCAQWGMQYEEILGSEDFLQQLADSAANYPRISADVLVIPPGGEVHMEQFTRE